METTSGSRWTWPGPPPTGPTVGVYPSVGDTITVLPHDPALGAPASPMRGDIVQGGSDPAYSGTVPVGGDLAVDFVATDPQGNVLLEQHEDGVGSALGPA